MKQWGGYQGLKRYSFGSVDVFLIPRFVNAAHTLGMGVMLDIVWNHADPNNPLIDYDGFHGNRYGDAGSHLHLLFVFVFLGSLR
jgi:1,4-alpha-glucan branching enzyme